MPPEAGPNWVEAEVIQVCRPDRPDHPLLRPHVVVLRERNGIRLGAPRAASRKNIKDLTERETEVLALVARGMSNAEIAEELTISPATAKTHVAHLLTKLDARDRIQLVIMAYQSGLVTTLQ